MLRRSISGAVEYFMPFRFVATHTVIPRYVPDDAVVLDAGANRGAFSRAIIAGTRRRCYAVEANPQLADRLRQDGRFEVLNVAMAGNSRAVEFVISEDSECSSLMGQTVDRRLSTVEMRAIDYATTLSELGLTRVDLLKLDIEGAEIEVLEAMSDAELSAIPQITVEFHDDFAYYAQEETRRVTRRLKRLGFVRICLWYGQTFDVAFLHTKLCPGARGIAFRTGTVGRLLVAIHRYLHWRLTQRGLEVGPPSSQG